MHAVTSIQRGRSSQRPVASIVRGIRGVESAAWIEGHFIFSEDYARGFSPRTRTQIEFHSRRAWSANFGEIGRQVLLEIFNCRRRWGIFSVVIPGDSEIAHRVHDG